MPAVSPSAVRNIASPASRQVMLAGVGGATAIGIALAGRALTSAPEADGSSPGRIDRAEVASIVSGPTSPVVILPLAAALLCIPMLYTKGRIVMGGPEGKVGAAALQHAVEAAGSKMVPNELARTKSTYAFMGGTIFGGLVSQGFAFGDSNYETRHVPRAD